MAESAVIDTAAEKQHCNGLGDVWAWGRRLNYKILSFNQFQMWAWGRRLNYKMGLGT